MARIRLINPAAPLDEDVARLSMAARLLWAYLPCHVDREGRMKDSAFTLKASVFPSDDVDVNGLLSELANAGHVVRYQVDGRRYIQIRNFAKYQSPHKNESPSTIPSVPVEKTPERSSNDTSARSHPVSDPVIDPVSEKHLPARDPGTTEHETAKEIAPHEVMALWGKARNEEFGGHPFDVNGLGIKPEAAREAADLINATIGGRPHVEPSMRKFWSAVKAGKFRESREMARKPAFAFGCWLKNDFIGDFEEATGAMPVIPAYQPGRSTASRAPPAANQPDRSRPRAYVPGET